MIDEHFQTMFSMALGISEPWFISDITMEQSEKDPTRMEMHISVNYAEGVSSNILERQKQQVYMTLMRKHGAI